MCYKDRTFCESDCTNSGCFRYFGPKERAAAIKWWGSEDLPLAVSDFSSDCEGYKKGLEQ